MGDSTYSTAYQGHTTGSSKLDVQGRIAQPRSVSVVVHCLLLYLLGGLLGLDNPDTFAGYGELAAVVPIAPGYSVYRGHGVTNGHIGGRAILDLEG